MTLENAKKQFIEKAADFIVEHGYIAFEFYDAIDLGNGHTVNRATLDELIFDAFDLAIKKQN